MAKYRRRIVMIEFAGGFGAPGGEPGLVRNARNARKGWEVPPNLEPDS